MMFRVDSRNDVVEMYRSTMVNDDAREQGDPSSVLMVLLILLYIMVADLEKDRDRMPWHGRRPSADAL